MNNEQINTNKETHTTADELASNYIRTGKTGPADSPEAGTPQYSEAGRWPDGSFDTNSLYVGLGAALVGVGAGLATMYFLDPNRGARRRALLTDKITSTAGRLPETARVTAVDISNRARGTWAAATSLFSSDNPADQVVEARVRSKMGRVCSHPHAVHVASRDGNITLDGMILAREVPELIKCIMGVRGVKSVDNRLQEFNSPEGISSLQGGSHREIRSEFMQQNWSPAARFIAGAAGAGALTWAALKHDLLSLGFGAAGAALLARSLTNTELTRLGGISGGRGAVTVEKSINVKAPVDVLWALWSNFENFPQFMSNVLEVRNINDNLSNWKVKGPVGIPVEWDAEITRIVPNEMIAWKSVEGSMIPNAGYVLFEPADDASTEVTVRISYSPPAGAVGHAVATLFGADPKTEMDADLMRMKTLLETGSAPHDAAQSVLERPGSGHVH